MYNLSAKFRSIFRILSVYLMSLLMFSGNSYGMESTPNKDYGSIDNCEKNVIKLDIDNKSVSINRPLSVAIFGENEEEVNKIANLLYMNDSNKTLVNHQLNCHPKILYESINNKELKFVVIPYEHGKLKDTIVDQFGEKSFDYFDIIIHISNKDTLTADRIKSFYDTLNYALLGKDYDENVYAPFGELRFKFWKITLKKHDSVIPRTLYFIFNGTRDELYKLDSFDEVNNYISAMPDSRSIYDINLDSNSSKFDVLINSINRIVECMTKHESLERIDKLDKILEKKKRKCSIIQVVAQNSRHGKRSNCCKELFGECAKPRVKN